MYSHGYVDSGGVSSTDKVSGPGYARCVRDGT
jgi:hypothetical protein